MKYLGDYATGSTLCFNFTTHKADGTPAAFAAGAVKVYKDDAIDSEVNTGVTLSVDHDSKTGLNNVKIVLTDAFYAVGHDYSVVVTNGTVDGVSVVGYVVATFSIENRNANVSSVSGAVGSVTGAVGSVTGAVGSVTATVMANLTPDYDAAKTAASQTSVNTIDGIVDEILIDTGTTLDTLIKDIPTNSELTSALSGITVNTASIADAVFDESSAGHTGFLTTLALASNLATVASNVSEILTDTGTTLDTLIKDIPTNSELTTALSGISVTINYASIADAVTDELLAEHTTADSLGKRIMEIVNAMGAGTGFVSKEYEVVDANDNPVSNVYVKCTSDEEGQAFVQQAYSNTLGIANFTLTPGTYYMHCQSPYYDFGTVPDVEVV